MEIHADKQLMQYQPFSDPNVILRYSLVGMTAPPLPYPLKAPAIFIATS